MSEHIIGSGVAFYRLEPCKINRITFRNEDAAVQGVGIANGRLSSTEVRFTLVGAIGLSSQFDLGGMSFPDGFTVHPTASTVTNIIVEYEDLQKQ